MTRSLALRNFEQKIILVFGAVLLLEAFVYIYLVNNSIYNVVVRKEAEEMISLTETEITGLVSQYMDLSQKVTMELARERGFVDAPAGLTVAVVAKPTVAFTSNNEI
ncbi:MAG: hypothetical protein A2571_02795 [Candidatus Vogelbacteria bacterium RIFOXYD1_FULL_44_32]|uniref:Cell division protein FtsL n=1 Tax=Candidatus Vogelbacteria bacterium RIFOXYD1_FULL_44_32 TaxID=1802438 RepID=A0A1G2QF89_9BACT|nr:MAG: hypothetical protein A2571_02795 [Candidatus Vogelbacteria bacterium RIFOXYD1_FULL_44_32]